MAVVKSLLVIPALRAPFALLAALAWLGVSNHCMLASFVEPASIQSAPSCHTPHSNHAPAKEKSRSDVECCKVLRARLALAKPFVIPDLSAFVAQPDFVSPTPFLTEAARSKPLLELDTGPPFRRTFVE